MRTRALLVLAGAATLGYGVVGLLRQAGLTHPLRWAADLLGVLLLHDLLLAPAVLGLLLVGRRVLPASWRAPAAAFLVIGGGLAVVAVPVLVRAPDAAANPSLLPRDYATALAGTLAVAAAAVLVGTLAARRLRRRTRR